jgi:hypothetical protein
MDIMTGQKAELDVAFNHQHNAQKDFHLMVLIKQLVVGIVLNA